MMNSTKLALLALVSVATLAACGNKNQDENGQQNGGQARVADVPARECVQPYMQGTYQQGYNPYSQQAWNPYQQAGFYPYDTRMNGGGCQPGTFPVCTAGVGLSCVPSHMYSHSTVAWYTPYQNGGIRFCGYAGYGGSTAGCSSYQQSFMGPNAFGRACQVNFPNSCGYGNYCQPLGYRSTVGVCVQ